MERIPRAARLSGVRGRARGRLVVPWLRRALRRADGIPNLRLPGDSRTEAVRRFYERAPFPGYPPRDSLQALRARAERSAFARLLDRAIPGDARDRRDRMRDRSDVPATWRARIAW